MSRDGGGGGSGSSSSSWRVKVWEKVSLKSSLGLSSLEGREHGQGEEWTGTLEDAIS